MTNSEFMHSRLNLMDDQITINYDLSAISPENDKKKKRKMSKRQKLAQRNNFKELTQEEIEKEIEFENDVELDKTLWRVLRDKKSVNNIL